MNSRQMVAASGDATNLSPAEISWKRYSAASASKVHREKPDFLAESRQTLLQLRHKVAELLRVREDLQDRADSFEPVRQNVLLGRVHEIAPPKRSASAHFR